MTYERAELILQQLMAGDRSMFLVARDGRAIITDTPKDEDVLVDCLEKQSAEIVNITLVTT